MKGECSLLTGPGKLRVSLVVAVTAQLAFGQPESQYFH